MKSVCKRIFNKNNQLIHEICGVDETIIKYDEKGRKIYFKNWNTKNGDIWTEHIQEFDTNGNLIHFKDIANETEYFHIYDKNNLCIRTEYPGTGEYINFEYDDHGNLIRDIDDEGNETIYENEYIDTI